MEIAEKFHSESPSKIKEIVNQNLLKN